jgi:hypothetical protein
MIISEEEVIRIYGKRWDIEVFFKVCKSYLKLSKGCNLLSYDARCRNQDLESIYKIFSLINKKTADIYLVYIAFFVLGYIV